MTKFSLFFVVIALSAVFEVSFSGSIGQFKNWDQFRSNHIGFGTDKCSALSGLLPDPKSGCCGRHADQGDDKEDDQGNDIDDGNIEYRTDENGNNGISNDDENSESGGSIINDVTVWNGNGGGRKCIDVGGIITDVVDNVVNNVLDRVTTWISGGKKLLREAQLYRSSRPSDIITMEDENNSPDKITDDYKSNSAGLSSDSVVGFIAEGKQAGLRQYPWLVHFSIETGGFIFSTKTMCGGSLISQRFVLTAAHCIYKAYRSYNDINIYLAEYNVNTSPDCVGSTCIGNLLMHPDKIIIHEAFEMNRLINDIALMRLKGSAPYTDYIRPICLPPFNIDVPKNEGAPLEVAGWGNTGRGLSPIKMVAQVQLVSQMQCKKYYNQLTRGQMCAVGRTGQNVCQGDSGGPLMMEKEGSFYLVGVISGKSRFSSCESSMPSFYTNVFAYTQWIQENMGV